MDVSRHGGMPARRGARLTAVTADIYSHVAAGMQTDAAERVAALVFDSPTPL